MEKTSLPSVQIVSTEGARVTILREPATESEVHVVTDVGCNITRFRTRVGDRLVEVLATPASMDILRERPTRWGSAALFPFPGRVAGGRFPFGGREIRLDTDQPDGNAIHGVVRARPWRITASGATPTDGAWIATQIATAEENIPASEWPFPFTLTMRVSLLAGRLRTHVEATNVGDQPMPMGLGFHPYFPTPLGPAGEAVACEIWVDATEIWDQDMGFPTGEIRRLGPDASLRRGQPLAEIETHSSPLGDIRNILFRRDTGNTSDAPGGISAGVRDPVNRVEVRLTSSAGFGALVLFTPPTPPVVSLEPHTCVPNAFNLANRADLPTGMITIDPGESWRGWYDVEALSLDISTEGMRP
jgi:aldose 1-epimerase